MTDKLYIVRHGFRLNWITSNWTSPTGLPRDSPLSAFGESQADEVAQYFASLPEDDKPTAIISSPYYRCLQTATPTAKALGLPIFVEHGVGEWYSPVIPGTGLHPRPGTALSLKSHFPEIDTSWGTLYFPPQKGESVEELHNRVKTYVTALLPALSVRLSEHAQKRLAIFSHAATTIVLVKTLIGAPDLNLRVGCCSISKLVGKNSTNGGIGGYEPIMLASASHMQKTTDIRDWGLEDILVDKGKVVEDTGISESENEMGPVGLQWELPSSL